MLKSDAFDMVPIIVKLSPNLKREDKKKLMNSRQEILCSGTFFGVIKKNIIENNEIELEEVKRHAWNLDSLMRFR